MKKMLTTMLVFLFSFLLVANENQVEAKDGVRNLKQKHALKMKKGVDLTVKKEAQDYARKKQLRNQGMSKVAGKTSVARENEPELGKYGDTSSSNQNGKEVMPMDKIKEKMKEMAFKTQRPVMTPGRENDPAFHIYDDQDTSKNSKNSKSEDPQQIVMKKNIRSHVANTGEYAASNVNEYAQGCIGIQCGEANESEELLTPGTMMNSPHQGLKMLNKMDPEIRQRQMLQQIARPMGPEGF